MEKKLARCACAVLIGIAVYLALLPLFACSQTAFDGTGVILLQGGWRRYGNTAGIENGFFSDSRLFLLAFGEAAYTFELSMPPGDYALLLHPYGEGVALLVDGEPVELVGEKVLVTLTPGKERLELTLTVPPNTLLLSPGSCAPVLGSAEEILAYQERRAFFHAVTAWGALTSLLLVCLASAIRKKKGTEAMAYSLHCGGILMACIPSVLRILGIHRRLPEFLLALGGALAIVAAYAMQACDMLGPKKRAVRLGVLFAALLCFSALIGEGLWQDGSWLRLGRLPLYFFCGGGALREILAREKGAWRGYGYLACAVAGILANGLAAAGFVPMPDPSPMLALPVCAGIALGELSAYVRAQEGGLAEASVTIGLLRRRGEALEEAIMGLEASRHDHHHHISLLALLWERGQYREMGAYLAEYGQQLRVSSPVIYCGHPVADAVFYQYAQRALSEGIRYAVHARIPADLAVPDSRLCSLLGNLLENAWEACVSMEAGDRWIDARADQDDDALILVVKNSYGSLAIGPDGRPMSRKRGGASDGVGMRVVKEIAAEFHGMAEHDANEETHVFRCLIRLNGVFVMPLGDAEQEIAFP